MAPVCHLELSSSASFQMGTHPGERVPTLVSAYASAAIYTPTRTLRALDIMPRRMEKEKTPLGNDFPVVLHGFSSLVEI